MRYRLDCVGMRSDYSRHSVQCTALACLLLGELGDDPPLHLNFLNNLGDGPPFGGTFWEKTMGYLGAQSRYTFFVSLK